MSFLDNPKLFKAALTFFAVTILLRQTGFSLVADVAIAIHTILLIFSVFVTGYHFYNSKQLTRYDMFAMLGISLGFLFSLRDTLVLGIMLVLLIFLISSTTKYGKSKILKIFANIILISTAITGTVVIALFLLFGDFGKSSEIQSFSSRDEKYQLVIEKRDAGATGGSTMVLVRRVFARFFQWERNIYSGRWNDDPVVRWVDGQTASIDGNEMNIFWGEISDY